MTIDYEQLGMDLLELFLKHASEFENLITQDQRRDLIYGASELTKYSLLYSKTKDEKYKTDMENAKLLILDIKVIGYEHKLKAFLDTSVDIIELALKMAVTLIA